MINEKSSVAAATLRGRAAYVNGRGQVSIEFILVLIFMLVVVSGIIVPLGLRLQNAMDDVSTVGSASTGLKRVSGSMNIALSMSGSSVQYVDFYIPKGASLSCDPVRRDINVAFPIHSPDYNLDGTNLVPCQYFAGQDPAMICRKHYAIPSIVSDFRCESNQVNPLTVNAGAVGFSQRFRIETVYVSNPPAPPFYTVDFKTG